MNVFGVAVVDLPRWRRIKTVLVSTSDWEFDVLLRSLHSWVLVLFFSVTRSFDTYVSDIHCSSLLLPCKCITARNSNTKLMDESNMCLDVMIVLGGELSLIHI